MYIPKAGMNIEIISYKHDRTFHRSWLENKVFYSDDEVIIGGNHQTIVKERTKTWRTKEPAIFYFPKLHWYNIVILFTQPNEYFYYCNLSSPFTYQQQTLQYTDYDIDIIVERDFTYKIVDENEYEWNKQKMSYPKKVQRMITEELETIQRWIREGRDPFNETFVKEWYDPLIEMIDKGRF